MDAAKHAKHHSFLVYCQVQVWMGRSADLKTVSRGWLFRGGKFQPKTMDSLQAPVSLIKLLIKWLTGVLCAFLGPLSF